MGSGNYDPKIFRAFSDSTVNKSTADIYSSTSIHKDLNPHGVKVRESRDSVDNPNSTPVIVGIDVTGSMGMIADTIARQGLTTLFEGIIDRKPITDPHVMFMAIGDANYDRAPLQVSQFEADKRIIEQLTNIYIEHGGGGNGFESYNLPWYFSAFHTEHDALDKRGRRGYLFTIGDEDAPGDLTRKQIETVCGDTLEAELSSAEMLAMAQRKYDVFHIIVTEGHHAQHYPDRTFDSWTKVLGERVIRLDDHTKLSETIISAIEIAEGIEASTSAKGWGGTTGEIVHRATQHLPRGKQPPQIGGPAA